MIPVAPSRSLKPALAGLTLALLTACAGQPARAPATPSAPAPSASAAPAPAVPAPQANASFADWLQGVRQEAAAKGVSQQTLDQALGGLEPDQKVLDLDRSQPEFTITFAQYRARTVTKQRVDQGRNRSEEHTSELQSLV